MVARKLSIVVEEDEEEQKEEAEEEEDLDEEEEDEIEGVGEIEEDTEEVEEDNEYEHMEEDEDDEEIEEAETKQLLSPAPPVVRKKPEKVGFEVSKELQLLLHRGGKKQITFSEKKHVFHYPKENTYDDEEEEEEKQMEDEIEEEEGTEAEEEEESDDDDDPLMEAESLQFSYEVSSNPEEQAEEVEEEYLLTLAPVENKIQIHANVPKEVGQNCLRMRNRRERESFTAT